MSAGGAAGAARGAAGVAALLAAWAVAPAVQAQAMSPERWLYRGVVAGEPTGAWNPSPGRDPMPNAVGAHAGFWGMAPNCADARQAPHPMARRAEGPASPSADGLPARGEERYFAPQAQAGCPPLPAASHVRVVQHENAAPGRAEGGIGMVNRFGVAGGAGAAQAFRGFDAAGLGGGGGNRLVEAVNFNFHLDIAAPQITRPFAGGSSMVFRAVQQVMPEAIVLTDPGRQQLRQVARVALQNESCRRAHRTVAEAACQVDVVAIGYIAGLNAWPAHSLAWLEAGRGALPVAALYLGPRNAPVSAQSRGGRDSLPVGVSIGEATQDAGWTGEREFGLKQSFGEFQNLLRLTVASRCCGGVVERTGRAQIAEVFGDRFDDPSEWVLLDVEVRDEIANHTEPMQPAAVGGHVSWIEVAAAR